jgi:nicotinamide riboside transporter PnuC
VTAISPNISHDENARSVNKGYSEEHMLWLWEGGESQALAAHTGVWKKESKLKKKEKYLTIIIVKTTIFVKKQ